MVVYSCHCLNVRIFAMKLEGTQNTGALGGCPLRSSCDFVELIDQGFHFNHKCLVHRVRDKDWTVYMCILCRMQTHAVNLNSRLVVVNSEMEKGDEAIQLIKNSPDFSPVFNLLLHTNDGRQNDGGGIQSQSYETLQQRLGDLQAALSKYLKQEEEAVEIRIKEYDEKERLKFARLKTKAQHDKAKLISVLFQNSEDINTKKAIGMSSMQVHVLSHSRSADEYDREAVSHRKTKEKQNQRIQDSSLDVFTMDEFSIDDVDEDCKNSASTNTFESKWKSDKLKGSYVQQFGRIRTPGLGTTDEAASGHEEVSLMSTSMPISMHTHAQNLRKSSYLDDDYAESAEFDDIPRNMQALSESIQEHDRYIFGDRPRQRVNTGDFSQVNWH